MLTARPGKSYSALFIVLRRMADKRAVAFTSVDASTFLFDSSGIWHKSSSSVDPMEDFPPVITNTHRFWSLVDFESTPARRDSQAHVISERTFYIIVSSPDWPHLDNFIKRGALRWVMSPWTDEELLALCVLYLRIITSKYCIYSRCTSFTSNAIPEYARSSLDTSGKVQTARVRYGPCPRDIIVSCRDPISIKCDLASAVQTVCDTDRIATLFINPFTPVHGVSHQIVLMRRVGDIDISRMQSDIWSTQIQSELAYKALYDRVEALGVDKVKDLMLDCRKVGPYAASLSEFLLELVALELLSGNAHPNGAFKFHHFAPMTEEGTSSESHLRQFAYSHANATATLSVTDTHRWELLQGTVPSTPPDASTLVPPTPFSCRPRSIVRYHQLDDILDITNGLYVPSRFRNPLFDAFFVESAEQETTVWLFQLMVSRDHDGAGPGSTMVQELISKAGTARPGLPISVKYVLVMPYEETWAVRWSMAPEFSNAEGDVFVQYLDIPCDLEGLVRSQTLPYSS